jgi:hypothetical protein
MASGNGLILWWLMPCGARENIAMRYQQLQLFTRPATAAMRDRAKGRNHSPEKAEFRRDHARRRRAGLARRHTWKLCRSRGCSRECAEVGLHDHAEAVPPLIWPAEATCLQRPRVAAPSRGVPAGRDLPPEGMQQVCRPVVAGQPATVRRPETAPRPEPTHHAVTTVQPEPARSIEPTLQAEPPSQAEPAPQAEPVPQSDPAPRESPRPRVSPHPGRSGDAGLPRAPDRGRRPTWVGGAGPTMSSARFRHAGRVRPPPDAQKPPDVRPSGNAGCPRPCRRCRGNRSAAIALPRPHCHGALPRCAPNTHHRGISECRGKAGPGRC